MRWMLRPNASLSSSESEVANSGPAPRRVTVLAAAQADIARLGEDDPALELRATALVELIRAGRVTGGELRNLPMYGDLSDCRKVYFAATRDGPPTHRLVYQVVGTDDDGAEELEVVEVVAVEARDEGYVYLLAADRLQRLPEETKPKKKRVHEATIARRGAQRAAKRQRKSK